MVPIIAIANEATTDTTKWTRCAYYRRLWPIGVVADAGTLQRPTRVFDKPAQKAIRKSVGKNYLNDFSGVARFGSNPGTSIPCRCLT
jgi:hypothetical protein